MNGVSQSGEAHSNTGEATVHPVLAFQNTFPGAASSKCFVGKSFIQDRDE